MDLSWEFIGLLPFRDDLRSDSVDAIDSLIDFGLDIRVLAGDSAIQMSFCFSVSSNAQFFIRKFFFFFPQKARCRLQSKFVEGLEN